jgi:probable HAF family extracellular repeat protein
MKLRFTRAGTPGGSARKMILAGLIAAVAIAGVATATIASASTRHQSRKSHGSSSWQASWKYKAVDSYGDSSFTQLLGVNDRGTVVGYYGSGADAQHPNRGFTISSPWTHRGNWHSENYPGSAQTQVVAISTNGATVGFFVTKTGANYGFVKWNGHMWPVAYPKTPKKNSFNQLLGVNDNGIAVGFFVDSAGNSHGYLYNIRTRAFFLLRVPVKATSVVITSINNSNIIVGFIVVGKVTVAFVVKNGVFHQLSFGGRTNTQALGVNSSGSVVGSFLDAAGKMHGFLWTTTGMHQIDSPWGTGGTLINGLNNNGILVGFFIDSKGRTRGFLVIASTTRATNYWWTGNLGGTVTPIQPSTSPSPLWPSTGPSASPGTVTNGGNLTNGGTNASSGTHW